MFMCAYHLSKIALKRAVLSQDVWKQRLITDVRRWDLKALAEIFIVLGKRYHHRITCKILQTQIQSNTGCLPIKPNKLPGHSYQTTSTAWLVLYLITYLRARASSAKCILAAIIQSVHLLKLSTDKSKDNIQTSLRVFTVRQCRV